MKFVTLFICCVLLFGEQSASLHSTTTQPPAIHFTHLTIEQGLSEGTVMAIAQDDRGFMWFGTQDGLDRYDGYTIEEFATDTSLPGNNIRALLADGDQLWVGIWGGGLGRIDLPTGNLTVFSAASPIGQRPGSDFIRAIYRDAQGTIWAGSNNGLDRWNSGQNTFTHYALPDTDLQTVYAFAEDAAGNLWLGTDAGVFRWQASSATIRQVMQTDNAPVTSLWMDGKRNQLWAGTRGSLYRLDVSSGRTSHFVHDAADPASLSTGVISSLFGDRPDRLWVGTDNGVDLLDLTDPIAFVHLVHDEQDPASLADGPVVTMFQDRLGGIWVGTWTSGLSYFHPARFKFPPAVTVPSFPVSFAPGTNSTLWVGTFEQGLLQLDKDYQTVATYRHHDGDSASLPNNAVMALLKDHQDRLWIGTLGGLCRLETDHALRCYSDINGRIRSLFEDDRGIIWIGTMEGLFRLDPADEKITHYEHTSEPGSLSSSTVLSIFQDHSGVLWFGTDEGLNRLESDATFSQPVHVGNFGITVIYEDRQNNVWLGLWGGGLAQIDPARQNVRYFTKADGLADNIVLGILPDNSGHLWISTSRGLSRFDLATASFRTFGLSDGLTHTDFAQGAFLKLPDDQLLLGNGAGIIHFTPEELPVNSGVPPVVLTGLQIFNQTVHPGLDSPLSRNIEYTDHLTLNHDQSIFSLEFAALNFVSPENSEYAYRLDGVDPDWNYTRERRFAAYTNLNPGEYTFHVRAANGDGVWNNDGVSLRITILPPWWATWWAYLLYGVGAIGLVAGVSYWRNRRYREKFATQQKLLDQEHQLRSLLEQLDVIQEEDRRRIAHEMHDGLAQTLASLRLRSRVWHTLLNKAPDQLPAEFDSLAQILDDSIQDIRRSIFALRPITLDEQGLFPALKTLAKEIGSGYGFEIAVDILCSEQVIHRSLEHPLFRMTQELLHNVGQHAHATHARLELSCAPRAVRLVVSDDGVGIDPDRQEADSTLLAKSGLGLRQMRERVQILGGSMQIESSPTGTRVSIELPLVS